MKKVFPYVFGLVLSLSLLSSHQISESCAWSDSPTHYIFFDTNLLQKPDYKPFQFTFDRLYDYTWDSPQGKIQDNLLEWQTYFKQQADTASIKQVVYQTTATQVQDLKRYILNLSPNIEATFKGNTLIQTLRQSKDVAFIDYLYLAKKIEPYVTLPEDVWEREPYTPAQKRVMRNLGEEAEKGYFQIQNNDFMRLRYAYQAIRLAHYLQEYAKAVDLYDKLVAPLTTNSIIKYWALSHKAGALKKQGKNTEAAYWFSIVFDLCPSRRVQAYYSFKLNNEAEWNNTLKMCQNDRQRSTLYLLRAINPLNSALPEMESIYQLNAQETHLDLLLLREINKIEYNLLRVPLSNNFMFYIGKPKEDSQEMALENAEKLHKFVQKALQERSNITQKTLWQLANAYLLYLQKQVQAAQQALKNIATPDAQSQQAKRILDVVFHLSTLNSINDAEEEALYQKVKQEKSEALKDFLRRVLEQRYLNQELKAKAFLAKDENWNWQEEVRLDLPLINDLLALMDKPNKTAFEREVLIAGLQRNQVLEIKATYLLNQNQLEEALAILKQLPKENLRTFESHPFDAPINDCLACDDKQSTDITKKNMVEMLLDWQKKAEKEKQKAMYYLQLGNAYYNFTYFGKSWYMLAYYRSFSELPKQQQIATNPLYFSCNKALEYYEKALQAAEREGNKELAAQACFMAAKCEQNQYFSSPNCKQDLATRAPDYTNYGKYFTQMKRNYTQTMFHKQAQKECFYYASFIYNNR